MDPLKATFTLASQVEAQALNSIVAGFSFASAIAYMDLVRWALSTLIKVNKNGGQYYLMTALLTTLLSIVVFMVIKRFLKPDIKAPSAPVYAVSA